MVSGTTTNGVILSLGGQDPLAVYATTTNGSIPTSYAFTGQQRRGIPIPLCLPSPDISRHHFPTRAQLGASVRCAARALVLQ